MSKFNSNMPKLRGTVQNLAGGKAYSLSKKEELATILLSSFVTDGYYRSAEDTLGRLHELAKELAPEFLMKTALFARDRFGMRSITHALAAHLAANVRGFEGASRFFDQVVIRVDDMSEILAYYQKTFDVPVRKNGKIKLPIALKRGFRKAFNRFDDYQLAKYIQRGKQWSLIDVVNMIRPVPTEQNAKSLSRLVNDTLVQKDTFATALSAAGGDVEAKGEALERLLMAHKMGYLQLLRNLCNIFKYCSETAILEAKQQLLNEKAIARSRIFPFQYASAYYALSRLPGGNKDGSLRSLLQAVSRACDISVRYVPDFNNTAVIIDDSGSMTYGFSYPIPAEQFSTRGGKGTLHAPIAYAAMLGAIAAKAANCDIYLFDTHAKKLQVVPDTPTIAIVEQIMENVEAGGTDFSCFWPVLDSKYDRIIVLSDMQGWVTDSAMVKSAFATYKAEHQADPVLYMVDLNGYGTTQLAFADKVHLISGYSDKIFQSMALIERGGKGLLAEIDAVEL